MGNDERGPHSQQQQQSKINPFHQPVQICGVVLVEQDGGVGGNPDQLWSGYSLRKEVKN